MEEKTPLKHHGLSSSHDVRPTVTVGMPIYNGALHLDWALKNLTEQAFSDFVIYISDNASTDETPQIIEKWAARDTRIYYHRQAENIGEVRNFRFVMDQAKSEYFMWHAYDDWLDPTCMQELVTTINSSSGCALACATAHHVKPDGDVIRRRALPDLSAMSRTTRIRTLLRQPESSWIYGLFRTKRLKKAYGILERFGWGWNADVAMLLEFVLNDEILATNRAAINYRVRGPEAPRKRPDNVRRFLLDYAVVHFKLFGSCPLSAVDKLAVAPWLLIHFYKTTESFIKRPAKRFIKGSARRLIDTVLLRPTRS